MLVVIGCQSIIIIDIIILIIYSYYLTESQSRYRTLFQSTIIIYTTMTTIATTQTGSKTGRRYDIGG